MENSTDILSRAQARAQQLGVPYRGVLLPDEAYALLQQEANAVLVDVRSAAEWQFVGTVPQAVGIELKCYPGMSHNPLFLDILQGKVPQNAVLMFLCRSGARSHEAGVLAASVGYTQAYNVQEGFEGEKNPDGHRGMLNGWKGHHLPWSQS